MRRLKSLLITAIALTPMLAAVPVRADSTTVVTPGDLAISPTTWYFYDDVVSVASTAEVAGKYQFVTGAETPPAGVGSIQFNTTGLERWNIATAQFAGTDLSDVDEISFTTYQPSSNPGSTNKAVFFNADIDFDNTVSNGYKGRLVYVPQDNGTVLQDEWQTWTINDDSLIRWSRYARGFDNIPGSADDNMWPDGNTTEVRTLGDVKTAFANAEFLNESFPGQVLLRAGEPYPDGFQGNTDLFSITVDGDSSSFDFEPAVTVASKEACKNGGWMTSNSPVFKNQGDCVSHFASKGKAKGNPVLANNPSF